MSDARNTPNAASKGGKATKMINASFYIAIQLLGLLSHKIDKANKRARRAGRPGFELTVDRDDYTDVEWFDDESQLDRTTRKVKVTIQGDASPIEGWQVVGAIDLSLGADILLGDVPESYRGNGGHCDHCGTRRNRKKTVVLRNAETGETKQVGATCLTAFLPGADVEEIAAHLAAMTRLASFARDFGDRDPDEGGSGFGSSFAGYDVLAVLAHATAAVRVHGYEKTSNEGDTTRGRVLRSMFPSKYDLREAARNPRHLAIPTAADWKRAEEIRAWLADEVAPTAPTGYLANLVAIAASPFCDYKHLGILCSAPQARKTDEERKAERERRAADRANDLNEHLGAVKDRIAGTFKVLWITYRETQWGETAIVKLADEQGRRAVWFASNDPDLEKGDVVSLKGTVKKLGEWKGTKETTLTRCRFEHEVKVEREPVYHWNR